MYIIYYILAILAGSATAVQAGVNSSLKKQIGNPFLAAFVSFLMGTIANVFILLFFNQNLRADVQKLAEVAWWKWTGGLLGAFFVLNTILSVEKIGAANYAVVLVSAQLVMAMLLDHFGIIGYNIHPISNMRLLGAVLVIAGAFIMVKN